MQIWSGLARTSDSDWFSPSPGSVMRSQLFANMFIYIYIHTCIHTYIHTYIVENGDGDGRENDEPCHDVDNDGRSEHHSQVEDRLLYRFHSNHTMRRARLLNYLPGTGIKGHKASSSPTEKATTLGS